MLATKFASKTLFAFAFLSACLAHAEGFANAAERVVSVNLCTDQMAMLLAPPEQLISISFLAQDPQVSAMTKQAENYALNHGGLEEIIVLEPDLVLAHEWTSPSLISALQGFGIDVEVFSTPTSLDMIPDFINAMGTALGRNAEAVALSQEFQSEIAKFQSNTPNTPAETLLPYSQNGWVGGGNALLDEGLRLSGFTPIAQELGFEHGGFMPLEILVTAQPDWILLPTSYQGASRADALLSHPALEKLTAKTATLKNANAFSCGLPLVTNGIAELQALRGGL